MRADDTCGRARVPLRNRAHRRCHEARLRVRLLRGTGGNARPGTIGTLRVRVGSLRIGCQHLGGVRIIDGLPRVGRIVMPGDLGGFILPVTVAFRH